MKNNQSLICVGKIFSAHGIKGQVKIKSYTENPKNITGYGSISDKNGSELKLRITSINEDMIIASIEGVTDRNHAEKMMGTELFVEKDALPEAKEGEYYHSDLIGLAVKDTQGKTLGKVSGINNFGAGDIIEIELAHGKKEMFIFDKKTVLKVDVAGGFITVNLPEEVIVRE